MGDSTQTAENRTTGLAGGFRGPRERRRIDGAAGSPLEGFWIEVDGGLTNGEIAALRRNTYWVDLHRLMAPAVVGWNYVAEIIEEVEVPEEIGPEGQQLAPARTVARVVGEEWLPPPAEAGPEVFWRLDEPTKQWILNRLKRLPEELDDGAAKLLRRLAGSPSGEHDGTEPPGSDAPSTTGNRTSRRGSSTR